MKRFFLRIFLLALCLCILLPMLFACDNRSHALFKNGISEVALSKKDKITVSVSLNNGTLEKEKGKKLLLYELLPGESAETVSSKQPLAEKKLSGTTEFKIDRYAENRDRLYSRFCVALSDGTPLGNEAWVSNPQFDVTQPALPTWDNAYKGIAADDPEDAWRLGAAKGLVAFDLSLLLSGGDELSFHGASYTYSKVALDGLMERILATSSVGMAVTLDLRLDPPPAQDTFCAALDLIFSQAGDKIGAVHVSVPHGTSSEDAVYLMQYTRLFLRSHNPVGDVYLNYRTSDFQSFKTFFASFSKEISLSGFSDWSTAITPDCGVSPWEKDGDKLTVSSLTKAFDFLTSTAMAARPCKMDITGLAFSATDAEKQAAELIYTYRLAANLGASCVYYGAHRDVLYGLYDTAGNPTLATQAFAQLDSSLSKELSALCDRYTNGALSKLPFRPGAVRLSGNSAIGYDGQEQDLLWNFAQNDSMQFSAIGGATAPTCKNSSAAGRPVLFTWLVSGSTNGEGIRKTLPDATSLSGAFSLSAPLLLQNHSADTSLVTLTLDGVNEQGDRLHFVSSVEVKNGVWQDVTFYINSFTASADLSKPCILTLTVASDAPDGTEYPMWLDAVSARFPESPLGIGLYALIILGCIIAGFLLSVCIYLLIVALRRRSNKRAQRLK